MKLPRLFLMLAVAALTATPARANEFIYDANVNAQIAKKLNVPVFFAVPESARLRLPKDIDISDKLIDFKHPDAMDAKGDVGLRLILTKRAGLGKRLGQAELLQTGDLLLSFRNEWGGAGPYPNVQMGISHVGTVYVTNGVAHNIDIPLSAEFLGPRLQGNFDGGHYNSIKYIHIVRPRGLTDQERDNLHEWASLLGEKARRIYPSEINFNSDYNAPRYKPGKPLDFVHKLGQVALGMSPENGVKMYCSEFAWSLLALRECNPDTADEPFGNSRVPSCIKPVMDPMHATGDYMTSQGRRSYSGLAEGPLLVINAMGLPAPEEKKLLHTVFVSKPGGMQKMSSGHRAVAEQMKPKFAPLEIYYYGVSFDGGPAKEAKMVSAAFNKEVPDNYSPTSFLINTLLPPDNANRTMDYVATIVLE